MTFVLGYVFQDQGMLKLVPKMVAAEIIALGLAIPLALLTAHQRNRN